MGCVISKKGHEINVESLWFDFFLLLLFSIFYHKELFYVHLSSQSAYMFEKS